jgi:hypothetical protein
VKGGFMPTYQPAILVNGVSADNLSVVENVIERDFERVLDALHEWQSFSDVAYDDSYDTPIFEAVRMPRYEYHNDKDILRHFKWKYDCKRISKRKEVK